MTQGVENERLRAALQEVFEMWAGRKPVMSERDLAFKALTDIRMVTGLEHEPMLADLASELNKLLREKDAEIAKLKAQLEHAREYIIASIY